jgi:hypothetical protein
METFDQPPSAVDPEVSAPAVVRLIIRSAVVIGRRRHGRTDADLDPVPLALAHPAEHGHDQVGGPEQAFSFRAAMTGRPVLALRAADLVAALFVSSAVSVRLRADTREA